MKDVATMDPKRDVPYLFTADDVSTGAFADSLDSLCRQYGVYGKIVNHKPYPASDQIERYIYLGLEPMPKNADITQIAVRPERNTRVFFPKQFALKLDDLESEDDPDLMFKVQQAVDYCRLAEFVKNLYFEYGTPVPDRILGKDLNRLIEFSKTLNTENLDLEGKLIYFKSLSRFFKRERTKNPIMRRWIEYKRSDYFLFNCKNIFLHLKALTGKKKRVPLDTLQENCASLSSTILPDHQVKAFMKYMDEHYPDISYAIGPNCITDYGILSEKQKSDFAKYGQINPYGDTVSYEEYCRVIDEKFQSEGFEAIKTLNPSRWEMHSLTYSSSDEPYIAKAFYNTAYQYAKKDSFQYIKDRVSYRGEDCAVSLPTEELLNFISLSNANGLHYFFDSYGYYGTPNLDTVYIAYNADDQKLVDSILARLVEHRVNNGHLATRLQAPRPEKLNQRIESAQKRRNLAPAKSKETMAQER